MNTTTQRGFSAMIAASVMWGMFSLIFAQLRMMPSVDIVAHRVVWGLFAMLLWLAYKGRLAEISAGLRDFKELKLLCLSAVLVAMNWLGFVYAVTHGYGLEASLGYFMFPLVSVALGRVFKSERLNRLQMVSVGFASVAVTVLTWGFGSIPWIAIYLSCSFAAYGLIKSRARSGAVLSVAIESVLLLPIALIWLAFANHQIGFLAAPITAFWLIMIGVLTGLSLIAFSFATKTISFVSVGMLFFINPVLQAFNAVVFLGEHLSIWHQIAFPLIGVGCVIYCYDLWKRGRREARR